MDTSLELKNNLHAYHRRKSFQLLNLNLRVVKHLSFFIMPWRTVFFSWKQTHSVVEQLCSGLPSAPLWSQCWESLMDSFPHSQGSRQPGKGLLDCLWTAVAKLTLHATSCLSPQLLSATTQPTISHHTKLLNRLFEINQSINLTIFPI